MGIKILCLLIFICAFWARLYQIDEIPPGLNIDEASMGYNAYSLAITGKDRYGQLPILFRSFESFQPPLYTYLTVIPVKLFGLSILSTRLVSVLSGMVVLVATFFILKPWRGTAFASLILLGFAPWLLFFNRTATEATLGLSIFVLAVYFFIKSLSNQNFLPITALLLGLATHAYYSERLISILFLTFGLIIFKDNLKDKKMVVTTIAIFILTQLPHLLTFGTDAFLRRLEQVSYPDNPIYNFASYYLSYFSPRSLFFEADPQPARSIPDLSVFLPWMFIPFIFGIKRFIDLRTNPTIKTLMLVLIIAPIPAALTKDPFYTLRVLELLWVLTIIIGFGSHFFIQKIGKLSLIIVPIVVIYSTTLLITSFTLLKYERAENYGYSQFKLAEYLKEDKHYIIDSTRGVVGTGIRLAFLKRYDPLKIQRHLSQQLPNGYYNNSQKEVFLVGNIEEKPLEWGEDLKENHILVGDSLTISEDQAKEHNLKLEFEVLDITGKPALRGYSINQPF